jgi:hypothetical protein
MDKAFIDILEKSKKFDREIGELLQEVIPPSTRRGLMTAAMCQVAIEHTSSQRVLLEIDHHVSALALVRLTYESLVRAIWMHHCASEEWINQFTAPMEPGQLSEPILGPPVASMLQSIDKAAPPFVGQMLRELQDSTWKPMNSYVHGGVRAIVQALSVSTPQQLISVMRNGNGFALMAANVFVLACNDASLAGRIKKIQFANLDCLPPINPRQ